MNFDSHLLWRRAVQYSLGHRRARSKPRRLRALHNSAVAVEQLEDRTLLSAADPFEPNNDIDAAHDFGQLEGFQYWQNLSVHESGNDDWYVFDLVEDSEWVHFAAIHFDHHQGDLDLALYNDLGDELDFSASTGDFELIWFDGLGTGTYYLEVYGFNGAASPDYTMVIEAAHEGDPVDGTFEADLAEPNNSLETAHDLGLLNGFDELGPLSIHEPGDEDWFRFETTAASTTWNGAAITFWHEEGDLDLELYNSHGELVGDSDSVDDVEWIDMNRLPSGEYFLRIQGFDLATNPDYWLTLNTPATNHSDFSEPNNSATGAYDLQAIQHDSSWDNLSIHEAGEEDWFAFTTLATGTITDAVGIEFDHELGDLDLSLFDSDGTLLDTSESVLDFEQISLDGLPAGNYQVQVVGFDGAVHPEYTLGITAPRPLEPDFAEENDTRHTAFQLRNTSGFSVWDGFSIHDASDIDWFEFDLVAEANWAHAVGIDFFHTAGDLDLALYDDNGELVAASSGIDDGEQVSLHGLGPGTYTLEVTGYDDATVADYAVWIEAPHEYQDQDGGNGHEFGPDWAEANDSIDNATPLREITGLGTWDGLSIHDEIDVDWFSFELLAEGTSYHFAAIDFDNHEGDLDLALFDSDGTLLDESIGIADFEEISLAGWPAGEYLLEVSGFQSASNPEYELIIDGPEWNDEQLEYNFPPDAHEPNNSKTDAVDLRTIEGSTTVADLSIDNPDDTDWFQFTLASSATEGHSVRIEFDHEQGDLDLALHNDNSQLDISDSVENFESISLDGLLAGTYWIEIFEYSGQTNPQYNLTIEAPLDRDPDPDRFEDNDTLETATAVRSDANTGTLAGDVSLDGLSIHSAVDADLFTFTSVATSTTAHGISIEYRHGDGDLVLELLDANGSSVATSTGHGGFADVSLAGLGAGNWYARVSGLSGDTNVYEIAFDAPVADNPGEPGDPTPAADAWTIMVYVTASNLESFAFADINEMEIAAAGLPGSVNLAVLWDQSALGTTYASGGGSQPAWGDTGRAFISSDSDPEVIATEFEQLGELNTGHPQTLADFIDWSVNQAPAEHYALLMWDHGSGLQGFNYDDLDGGTSDHLTTPELVEVLADPNRPVFDVISFDACLMAMAEVGFSLANYTDVFVASQEVVGADGHDYTTLFDVLQTNPQTVGAQALATGFVDSYQDQYQGDFWGWDTQSAISTSGYTQLLEALADFVDAGLAGTSQDVDVLRDARADAITYDIAFLRDLGSFVGPVADNSLASEQLRLAAEHVEDAIDDMTLARSHDNRNSSGISIFLPDNATTAGSWYTTPYSDFELATGWSNLIEAMGGNGRSGSGNSGGRSVTGPDWSEQNNVAATAHDLNSLVGDGHVFSQLNLHTSDDIDWFRLAITADGTANDRITVTPSGDASEAVRLTLFDSAGQVALETSDNGPGPQQVSLDGLAAGTYLVRIDPPANLSESLAVSGYELEINAPDGDAASDWAGDNSSQNKAFHLGTIGSNTLFSGLGVAANTDDWFTFDTPRRTASALYALGLSTPLGQPLTASLIDSSGRLVDQATGDGMLELDYVASGASERLTLQIHGGTDTSAYSLHFAPVTATIAVDLDADGNLVVTDTSADGQDDVVLIRTDGDWMVIETPGHVIAATVGSSSDPHSVRVPLDEITGEMWVEAQAGDDRVDASGSLHPVRVYGGSGHDTLVGGHAADVLNGGSGNDVLEAQGGNDRVFGGRGLDQIRGGPGDDYLHGHGGADWVHGDDGDDTVNGGSSNDRLFGNAGNDRLNGNDGHDLINGNSGDDTAQGGDGNDVIRGGSGNDWLGGGAGGDRENGQGGNDTLHGGASNDRLDGGTGNDLVYEIGNVDFTLQAHQLTGQGQDELAGFERGRLEGGSGNNVIDASQFPGSVVLLGGAGHDLLRGGHFFDRLVGQEGNDTLEGLGGDDRIFGGIGEDRLDGGLGDDFLRGHDDADRISGGAGNDTLNGEAGDDSLYGGDGDDVIRGGMGNDHAAGEAGFDRVFAQAGYDSLCSDDDDLLVGTIEEIDRCATVFTDWADQLG
jgi:Ca2+-binding RTX toxin-like protein